MSCENGVEVMIGTSLFTQDIIIDLPEEFVHAVEVADPESKRKRSVAALSHIPKYMNSINYKPSEWENL